MSYYRSFHLVVRTFRLYRSWNVRWGMKRLTNYVTSGRIRWRLGLRSCVWGGGWCGEEGGVGVGGSLLWGGGGGFSKIGHGFAVGGRTESILCIFYIENTLPSGGCGGGIG